MNAPASPAIVVATDFSDDAWHAASRAAQLSQDAGFAVCRLVHVVEASWLDALGRPFGLSSASRATLLEQARDEMNRLVDALRSRTRVPIESDVLVGPVVDTLVERSADAPLLVLGARGENPARDLALGTTAERVLRKRRESVLVVRAEPHGAYRRVLVPVDFSAASVRTLAQARALAPGARLDVLHAFDVPFEGKLRSAGVSARQLHEYRRHARESANAELARLLSEGATPADAAHRLVKFGHAPRVIVDVARARASELIAIGKRGTRMLEELLLGSVTLHVLGEASCDVLVVPPGDAGTVAPGQSSNGRPT